MRLYVRKDSFGVKFLWIDFNFQGKRYRKPLKLKDNAKNRKHAKEVIIPQIQVKLNDGALFETTIAKVPTLDTYKDISFAMHSGTRRESTKNDYRISYDLHIGPHLGEKRLDLIKPSDIALWQSTLLQKLSPRRVKNVRAVLSGILKDAMRDEIINKNPLSLVAVPKVQKVDIFPFSKEEIFEILDHSEGQYRNFFALGFFSGMRSGEMIGLRWEDVDFKRNEIHIRRSIKMGNIDLTKTVESRRVIDIIPTLLPFLRDQFERTGKEKSYLFLNDQNTHFYDIKRIRDSHWKRTLKRANFKYRTIYQTRHTFATVMLENGEDILWVSHMLGHTDTTTTLQNYARYIKRDNKIRAAFLEQNVS